MKKICLLFIAIIFISEFSFAQCADTMNIYTFQIANVKYELVRENKTWVDAAACAVQRGGFLAEIKDVTEQNAIMNELANNASIVLANTVAPDGGGASYVWLGGNDRATEGNWIWDGNNDGNGPQFWMGTSAGTGGMPVGNLYNNWGDEPDDFGLTGQDGLGLALTNWPLGLTGQWNDVHDGNTLYYLIEFNPPMSLENISLSQNISIYPNPVTEKIQINNANELKINQLEILNALGQTILTFQNENEINLGNVVKGIYFLKITFENGEIGVKRFVKWE